MKWTADEYVEFSRMTQEKIFQFLLHSPALKDCKVADLQGIAFQIQKIICNDFHWKNAGAFLKEEYKTDDFFNSPFFMNDVIDKFFKAKEKKDESNVDRK